MTHTNETIEQLITMGFTLSKNHIDANETTTILYKRTSFDDSKMCICNQKVPQIVIKCHRWDDTSNSKTFESYAIELCQESNLGWCNLEFYGLSGETLLQNYDKYEKALIDAWEACWE